MSGRDEDEESAKDLWEEVEEFVDADPIEVEEFVDTDPVESDPVESDPIEPDPVGSDPIEPDPVGSESVTDPEPTDDSPTEAFGEREQATVDDQVPNTEDAPDADEVFDEMDVSAVDGEALWDELAGTEAEAESFNSDETTSDGSEAAASNVSEAAASVDAEAADLADTEPVESSLGSAATAGSTADQASDATETLVDKRAYCQQCPFFSEPPNVSCGHAGTEIVEVLKDGRFRVRNCPVVTDTGPDRTILNDGD